MSCCLRCVSLLGAAVLLFCATAARGDEVSWYDDYDAAVAASQQQGRPLLVFLTMSGCRYCEQMKQTTFRDPEVATVVNRGYVAVRLGGAEGSRIAHHIGARLYPTTVLATPDRRVRKQLQGYTSPGALRQAITEVNSEVMLPGSGG